jgi:hypothetical protein
MINYVCAIPSGGLATFSNIKSCLNCSFNAIVGAAERLKGYSNETFHWLSKQTNSGSAVEVAL